MNKAIFIKTLGSLTLSRDGQELPLPASKKTRALLAFLAISARPHRRERLCELFWEAPDDPRGALRWSLSKLRGVLKSTTEMGPIIADRERAQLNLEGIDIDFSTIRKTLFDQHAVLPLAELRSIAAMLEQPLLDGLDLPNQPGFQSWLVAEREDARLLRVNVMRRLTLHPEIEHQEACNWARRWLELDPFSDGAAEARVMTLRRLGQLAEAQQVIDHFTSSLQSAGLTINAKFETSLQEYDRKDQEEPNRTLLRQQNISFCKTADNVRIAYATVGSGRPIVKAANWLNHLELDWDSPIWGDLFHALAKDRTFIRYDERGNGLSDWDVDEINQAVFVNDLETVVDQLELKKFPLLGISQGCAVSIEYAVRHPERVSALILISGYASGWRIGASVEEQAKREAVMTLTQHGWGGKNPAYRHIFTQTFMPDAKPEELDWFDEFQRQTTSPENAVRFQQAFADIDVRALLSQVNVPTIVFHSRHDQRISLEQGREVANGIPNARFVALESNNHILLGHEPAWQVVMDETERFLAEHKL
ncbi:alpha/beta hydrolase [Arenicella xantha]|uniref:Pimeloyl-ACP methyl ester carboxylesterase n=1 Tax=Arenicella xantha TaxID=644221 RepID=A0A395JJV7_9GAMM|nr:alpha/beta hydrolase [Arenicella xantha]RBP51066.1 pimeloyl-ACP methyl ester carboxylesterase [Arenicella xantha]